MAGRRSDARQKMVVAARRLIRAKGYHATALSDVLELSAAPRGSVYFHFPGGKAELAIEAAEQHARDQVTQLEAAAEWAETPADLVRAYVEKARDNLVASDYQEGCTLAPFVIESPHDTEALTEVAGRTFTTIIDTLAAHLTALGLAPTAAHHLANASVAGVEGALVTARALRDPAPFESVLTILEDRAGQLSR